MTPKGKGMTGTTIANRLTPGGDERVCAIGRRRPIAVEAGTGWSR